MSFSLVYLANRFLYRLSSFFYHWYIDGTRWFAHRYIVTLEGLDETFAVHITLRHYFEPLYKDYSIVGRILGIVFRSGRILIGLTIYLFVTLVWFALYLIWLGLPVVLLTSALAPDITLPRTLNLNP